MVTMCPNERIEGPKEPLAFLEDMEFLGIRGLEEILGTLHDLEGGKKWDAKWLLKQ